MRGCLARNRPSNHQILYCFSSELDRKISSATIVESIKPMGLPQVVSPTRITSTSIPLSPFIIDSLAEQVPDPDMIKTLSSPRVGNGVPSGTEKPE